MPKEPFDTLQAIAYCDKFTPDEPGLLADLREATRDELRYDDMLSGPEVCSLLQMLVRVSGARRILEIGTFTGYATLSMALAAAPGTHIITCESNEKYAGIARRFFARFGKTHTSRTIELRLGDARTFRPVGAFDLIFLDADKQHYPQYYQTLMPGLRQGGVLVVDNVFWGGLVWGQGQQEASEANLRKAEAIDRLNRMIAEDRGVGHMLLPIRDGVHVAWKK